MLLSYYGSGYCFFPTAGERVHEASHEDIESWEWKNHGLKESWELL